MHPTKANIGWLIFWLVTLLLYSHGRVYHAVGVPILTSIPSRGQQSKDPRKNTLTTQNAFPSLSTSHVVRVDHAQTIAPNSPLYHAAPFLCRLVLAWGCTIAVWSTGVSTLYVLLALEIWVDQKRKYISSQSTAWS